MIPNLARTRETANPLVRGRPENDCSANTGLSVRKLFISRVCGARPFYPEQALRWACKRCHSVSKGLPLGGVWGSTPALLSPRRNPCPD